MAKNTPMQLSTKTSKGKSFSYSVSPKMMSQLSTGSSAKQQYASLGKSITGASAAVKKAAFPVKTAPVKISSQYPGLSKPAAYKITSGSSIGLSGSLASRTVKVDKKFNLPNVKAWTPKGNSGSRPCTCPGGRPGTYNPTFGTGCSCPTPLPKKQVQTKTVVKPASSEGSSSSANYVAHFGQPGKVGSTTVVVKDRAALNKAKQDYAKKGAEFRGTNLPGN